MTVLKEIYLVLEIDQADTIVNKIVNIYKRQERAESVCFLLKSQYPDKNYRIQKEVIR